MPDTVARPQGIEESHTHGRNWYRFANPLSVLGVGLFLAAALAGVFGGQPHPAKLVDVSAATMRYEFPEILRNGEFFEMRVVVDAKQPFSDLQIGISSEYWRDLTINTMIPAASEEKAEKGVYLFSYGEMEAGDRLTIKIDGQINPPMFAGTRGELTLRDGDRVLGSVPVKLRVYP